MAAVKTRTSSFSQKLSTADPTQGPGLKCWPNGTVFLSSGIPDLDSNGLQDTRWRVPFKKPSYGDGNSEGPHHMLLLRNFMAQGLIHNQPLLYASPARDPIGFFGLFEISYVQMLRMQIAYSKNLQEKGLRIAWQYKKYFGENQLNLMVKEFYTYIPLCQHDADGKLEYSNELYLRKPLERHFLNVQRVDCVSIQDSPDLSALRVRCATFLSQFPRNDGNVSCAGRITIQSFCAPQCAYSNKVSSKSLRFVALL
ncbi:hypothetical protein CRYUN_Cryun09bG0109400 [Craigia yunnanensis]